MSTSSCPFTLYVTPLSPSGRKVLAVVYHLGLSPELKMIDLSKGEQKAPEFLQINPNGRNPALCDGDFKLWESNAILQYLSERYADFRLWGKDPQTRADVSRWLFWESAEWNPSISPIVFENMIKPMFMPGSQPDQAAIQRAKDRLANSARVLDSQLASRRFITGDELTLADFSVAALLTYWQPGQVPLQSYEHILAWLARMNEVPAWKQTTPQFPPRPAS